MEDYSTTKEEILQRAEGLLTKLLPESGEMQNAVPGLTLGRRDNQCAPCSTLNEPFVSLLVQGVKHTVFPGMSPFEYKRGDCLVLAVSAPTAVSFLKCSVEKPLLYISLRIDYQIIKELLTEVPSLASPSRQSHLCSACVINADELLCGALLRLLELSFTPERAPVLAPLISKEIHYYLLLSAARGILADFALSGVLPHQLARSISYLKENYQKPVFVEDLARMVHMAPSTFFRHFKALIGLTPMQYHKQLRLYAARKLLWQPGASVSRAAFEVGYESPSQFSRDYKKLFGRAPSQELKTAAADEAKSGPKA